MVARGLKRRGEAMVALGPRWRDEVVARGLGRSGEKMVARGLRRNDESARGSQSEHEEEMGGVEPDEEVGPVIKE